jgi:hypothetical protein
MDGKHCGDKAVLAANTGTAHIITPILLFFKQVSYIDAI